MPAPTVQPAEHQVAHAEVSAGNGRTRTQRQRAKARAKARAHRNRIRKHRSKKVRTSQTTPRWSGALDTSDRAVVNAAYWDDYAPGLDQETGWTGSNSRCQAGTTSAASRGSTLSALNYARSLAGLAPVTFSATLNQRAQQTALIMSANEALSHEPPSSWRCWSSTGAANAGRSNIAIAWPSITSSGLVSLYLEDYGTSNRAVGHRRWLLNPFATQMGSGSTDTANAITVMGPTSSSRPNPTWVAWPSAGWFPNSLEPSGRWSLSSGNRSVDFGRASVRVYRDGSLVRTVRHPVAGGYGQPTLAWQMPDGTGRSGTFRVVVSGIRLRGSENSYTSAYDVRMFAPTR